MTSTRSLRTRIATKLGLNLLIAGVLVNLVLHGMAEEARYQVEPYKAPAAGSPVELVEAHDCWTGAAPVDQVGKVPGHVVVTKAGEIRYGGRGLVHKALQQTFEGVDHGLTVHGFCR